MYDFSLDRHYLANIAYGVFKGQRYALFDTEGMLLKEIKIQILL